MQTIDFKLHYFDSNSLSFIYITMYSHTHTHTHKIVGMKSSHITRGVLATVYLLLVPLILYELLPNINNIYQIFNKLEWMRKTFETILVSLKLAKTRNKKD